MVIVRDPRLSAVVRAEVDGRPFVMLPGKVTDRVIDMARAVLSADELRELVAVSGDQDEGGSSGTADSWTLRIRPGPVSQGLCPGRDRDVG